MTNRVTRAIEAFGERKRRYHMEQRALLFAALDELRPLIEEEVIKQADCDGYQVLIPFAGSHLEHVIGGPGMREENLNSFLKDWLRAQSWGPLITHASVLGHYRLLQFRWA